MGKYFSRYKPVGWRGESQRHYLAAKGIKTRKYLAVQDFLKGNRPESPTGSSSLLHAFYQEGYSDEDILARRTDPAFADAAVDVERKRASRSPSKKFDVPDSDSDESQFQEFSRPVVSAEQLPVQPIPEEAPVARVQEPMSVSEPIGESSELSEPTAGNTVVTPGVPPAPPTLSDVAGVI